MMKSNTCWHPAPEKTLAVKPARESSHVDAAMSAPNAMRKLGPKHLRRWMAVLGAIEAPVAFAALSTAAVLFYFNAYRHLCQVFQISPDQLIQRLI